MTPKPHNDPVAEAEQELADALAHEADIENRYAEGEDVPATVFEQADQRKTMAQRGIERAKRLGPVTKVGGVTGVAAGHR